MRSRLQEIPCYFLYVSLVISWAAFLPAQVATPANGAPTQGAAPMLPTVIHGQVVDPSGARIPGATITVTDAAGDNAASATSDALGNFQVKNLTPVSYTHLDVYKRQDCIWQGVHSVLNATFKPEMAQAPVRKPALRRMLSFFATGKNQPLLADKSKIDRLYKRHRILIMTAITLGDVYKRQHYEHRWLDPDSPAR